MTVSLALVLSVVTIGKWKWPRFDGSEILDVQILSRTVRIGRGVQEAIFSCLPGYLGVYQNRYQEQPITKSPATTRFEGFLFGFPPCCVDAFLQAPYKQNALSSEDQKILFHWACSDCQITPILLTFYRKLLCVYDQQLILKFYNSHRVKS